MKSDRQTTINLCLFVAMVLAVSCSSSNQQGPRGAQEVQSYPVLEIRPQSIELTTSYPATLEGLQTVEIRARVQGYIVEMPVDEGDIVEEGQVLFRLNSEQYEQDVRSAEADVEAAKAAVETARDEVPMRNPFGRKLIGRMATTLTSTGRSVILPGGLISESNSILKLIMYEFQ